MSFFIDELEDDRRRSYRRMVALSSAAHVGLLAVFLIRPPSLGETKPLPPVVSLVPVSALTTPKPVEKPTPPPEAEPAPPPPALPEAAQVVIPEHSVQKPKPKPKPVEREPEVAPRPKEPEQVDLDDLLNELREEIPASPEPVAKPAEQAAVAGPSGPGVVVTPEVLAWINRVKAHVKRNWALAPGFRAQRISTEVRVTLTASGEVIDFEITRRSRNPWYDDSVERAVRKATPLPRPPQDGDWTLTFEPGDLL